MSRVEGTGVRVWELILGLGLRVWGLGVRVSVLGFRELGPGGQ